MRIRFQGLRLWRTGRYVDLVVDTAAATELIDETGALAGSESAATSTVDMSGMVLAPAFQDPHVHFRDPGQVDKEDMVTGCTAAAAGGYGQVLILPNTEPAMDGQARMDDGRTVIEYLQDYEEKLGRSLPVRYALCVSASKDRAGQEPSNPDDWGVHLPSREPHGSHPGAVAHPVLAISDDGSAVTDRTLDDVARIARDTGLPILDHCEHHESGFINEGEVSRRLGVAGVPASTELDIVQRDIDLARRTGTRVHLQHVSTAAAFQAIRRAKEEGLPVTCETAPHYLALCDEDVLELGAMAKMNPPLRSRSDRESTLEAVADGTVDMIATDHAPHTVSEKAGGLVKAPNGIIGLETAYAICNQALVESGVISHQRLVELMSLAPAELLGTAITDIEDMTQDRNLLDLTKSEGAGLVVLDPAGEWTVDAGDFHSKASNTPFQGWEVRGRVLATIKDSHLVFSRLTSGQVKGSREGRQAWIG